MAESEGSLDDFTPERIAGQLRSTLIGRRIEVHRQVGSTNDLARDAGRRGEPEGLAIVAEEQVTGRGRLGRVWVAPPGCCVLCSILLRPRFLPEYAFYLTVAASLAIHRTIKSKLERESETRQHPSVTIKWPNDVLVGGRKIAGVLGESEFAGDEWLFSVVGFGANVNLPGEELGSLAETATSLLIEVGHPVDRAAFLAAVLSEFEALYLLLQSGRFVEVYAQWIVVLETIGRWVTVREGDSTLQGQALRVDTDGGLVLRQADGVERRVLAGDVLPDSGGQSR